MGTTRGRAYSLFFVAFIVCVLFSSWIFPQSTHAVGISPGVVNLPHVLRDSSQKISVVVLRDNADTAQQDQYYAVTQHGAYAEHITILGDEEFVIPKGEKGNNYIFHLAPQGLPNGDYQTFLTFAAKQVPLSDGEEADVSQVNVVNAVTFTINFTITDEEIIEYSIQQFAVTETEVGQHIIASFDVNNTGNVLWKPSQIEFTFTNALDPKQTTSATVTEDALAVTEPGTLQTLDVSIDNPLSEGKYYAEALVYAPDGKIIPIKSSNSFLVHPTGTLQQRGELISVKTNKKNYRTGERIQLEAVFENTGDIAYPATLIIDVYDGDTIIDSIEDDEKIIAVNEEVTLSRVFTLPKAGSYVLSAYVDYGRKTSEIKNVEVGVYTGFGMYSTFMISLLLIACIIFVLIALLIYKKIYEKNRFN